MKWTCGHCGKALNVSEEQLYETRGVIVCPQCLSSDTVPGYQRRKRTAVADTPSSTKKVSPPSVTDQERERVSPPPKRKPPTPPPYRKKISFVEESTSRGSTENRTKPSVGKKKRKKKKTSGLLAPTTSLGCLWRTLVFTAILLAVVTFVGYVLDVV